MKMADSQKMGSAKSGGQRMDDHSFWAGSKSKDSVFPKGVHTKDESSAEGAGEVMKYEDTSKRIRESQVDAVKKVKSHQGRLPEHRN